MRIGTLFVAVAAATMLNACATTDCKNSIGGCKPYFDASFFGCTTVSCAASIDWIHPEEHDNKKARELCSHLGHENANHCAFAYEDDCYIIFTNNPPPHIVNHEVNHCESWLRWGNQHSPHDNPHDDPEHFSNWDRQMWNSWWNKGVVKTSPSYKW